MAPPTPPSPTGSDFATADDTEVVIDLDDEPRTVDSPDGFTPFDAEWWGPRLDRARGRVEALATRLSQAGGGDGADGGDDGDDGGNGDDGWFGRLRRSRIVMVVLALLALFGIVLPVLGFADEMLAFAGERVFGVPELPEITDVDERSAVLDADGEQIAIFAGPENRIAVELDDVPDHVVAAVLATEDQRFYDHEGISVSGIARAAVVNLVSGGVEQGGSTITQQYVKNALLTSERSLKRKITEATWAVRLEQELDKDTILERYLNILYLGDGTYGLGAASSYWFDKDVSELSVADGALLAGMIRAPEATNPSDDPEAAERRRNVVLGLLLETGAIDQAEHDRAAAASVTSQLEITPLPTPDHGFFVEYVRQQLLEDERLGPDRRARENAVYGGGLVVRTTIDSSMQAAAEQTLAERLTDPTTEPMAGLVSVDPATGAVRSMAVGPHGFGTCVDDDEICTTTTVNPLVEGMGSPGRQVGSAFKPIVQATALSEGLPTDWHTYTDSGSTITGCGNYAPQNYDGSDGAHDMYSALVSSNNVFHVKLGVAAGLDNVVDMAARLGMEGLEPSCSMSLGAQEAHGLQMAAAYAAFVNDGIYCQPFVVTEVIGRDGESLGETEPDCERAMDSDVAAEMVSQLRGVVNGGTAHRARLSGRDVIAKTGTTNDNLDAWLVGATAELATASWVGFEVPEPMRGVLGYRSISGGTLPAELWATYMGAALDGTESGELPSVGISRYTMPECPPPLPPEEDKGGKDGDGDEDGILDIDPGDKPGRGNRGATTESGTAESGGEASGSGYEEGFDHEEFTLETDVDGDDFAEGHQPERCEPQGTPEEYAAGASAEGSGEGEAGDEPTHEPTDGTSDQPTDEPTDGTSDQPTDEPTDGTSDQPTDEPTDGTSDDPTNEPAPGSTADSDSGDGT